MERKRLELVLAALFFVTGVFLLIFSQAKITGGVIGINDTSTLLTFIGFLLLCSSLIFFVANPQMIRNELLVNNDELVFRELDDKIKSFEPFASKALIVLDPGFVSCYRGDTKKLVALLNTYYDVFVPQSVFSIVKDKTLRSVLTDCHKPAAKSKSALMINRQVKKLLSSGSALDKQVVVNNDAVEVFSSAVALILSSNAKTVVIGKDPDFSGYISRLWKAHGLLASKLRYFKF